jgi:uncharacterized protein YecE (DUF72 family)
MKTVENWRRMVPDDFTFAVRCHQDLTHRVGLKPVDEAYCVIVRMLTYCEILEAPYLVLVTPARYILNSRELQQARDFLSSINLMGVRLVWEVRAPVTRALIALMEDFNVIQSVDLSRTMPRVKSNVVYARLFGKGKHNLYQFTDDELLELDKRIEIINPRITALSYHGVKMNSDAARFISYKKTGSFLPVTSYTGVDSAKALMSEDAHFPASKSELMEQQGWKVVDLTAEKRSHLCEWFSKIPDKIYESIEDVVEALEAIM